LHTNRVRAGGDNQTKCEAFCGFTLSYWTAWITDTPDGGVDFEASSQPQGGTYLRVLEGQSICSVLEDVAFGSVMWRGSFPMGITTRSQRADTLYASVSKKRGEAKVFEDH